MKHVAILGIVGIFTLSPFARESRCQEGGNALTEARNARDRGDAAALRAAIHVAHDQVAEKGSSANYQRLALLEDWMCEVGYSRHDDELITQAAESGVAAADEASKLDPNSSEAHWLLGDLLGQLIPHVFGGGMRYGKRSTHELEKAIELNPRSAEAYVSRATSYYFTPAMFGGNKQKAIEMLRKAIVLDPSSDAADTAHIWLAQIYEAEHKHADALREANEALKLDPGRAFAQYVSRQVSSK